MKFLELEDSISRFRFSQSCIGLAGCLCVCYAVWTPCWLNGRGLWAEWNNTKRDEIIQRDETVFNGCMRKADDPSYVSPGDDGPVQSSCLKCRQGSLGGCYCDKALEAERVFGVLASLMALSTAALCLVFALCWTSQTVRSYSNTRSLLMAGQALYPTTLLLLTMICTGFFFLLSWSFFTYQHKEEIRQDFSGLGSSYWLGAFGWVLLLVVEVIVFIAEQAVVPDILPDLEKAVESWRIASQLRAAKCSFSDGYHRCTSASSMTQEGYMSGS